MTKQTGEKSLPVRFYAVAISLLLLTFISCQIPQIGPFGPFGVE